MAWQNSWFPALMFENHDLLTGIANVSRNTSDLHRPVPIVVQIPGIWTIINPAAPGHYSILALADQGSRKSCNRSISSTGAMVCSLEMVST